MRSILLPVAAFAAILPAAAIAAPTQQSFVNDGQTYYYSAERQKDGTYLVAGKSDDGEAFRLTVAKNHVEGQMGMTPVEFFISKSTMDKLAAETSASANTAIAAN